MQKGAFSIREALFLFKTPLKLSFVNHFIIDIFVKNIQYYDK
jgi:hypothetical protein